MAYKLQYTKLKKNYNIDDIRALQNGELDCSIIGQKNAIEALEFGIGIKERGYNIYVSGEAGLGKTTFSKKYAQKYANNEKTPDDILYVYNFENPKNPIAIFLKSGCAEIFKSDIDDLINTLSVEVPKAFSSTEQEEEKNKRIKKYNMDRDKIIKEITELAKEQGFGMKNANTGIYFMPIIDGKVVSEEEFEKLDTKEKEKINEKSYKLQEDTAKIIKCIKELEKNLKKDIEDLEYRLGLFTVGKYMNNLQEKYIDNKKISEYLINLKEDIIDNIYNFLEEEMEDDENVIPFSFINKKMEDELFPKYKVNILVNNKGLDGAPVVLNYNPSYTNLVGEIEFENELGNFTTDYMKIKGGLLHKANGGYLILHIEDILKNMYSLETIIRVLKTEQVLIEPLKDYQIGGVAVTSIKPEPIDINVKVIIIGSSYYYDMLMDYEEDFLKYFKINCMFDYEMENNNENIQKIIKYIKNYEKEKNLLKFDETVIKPILEHINKMAGRQDMLSTKFSVVSDILIEANHFAKADKVEKICEKYINMAIKKKIDFVRLYENKLKNMIMEKDIIIHTSGQKIGEINGLCVLDFANYSFGVPTKITATTYMGQSGIINVEKEARLSGKIHNKGMQVITGYIGHMYADRFPLSLSCRVCFEQNYSGIDGDSASSTELYAIISSLADAPIKQSIAVTGSVNQMGQIQPIGGINEKIEGFFDICKERGLTGDEGVVMPIQNVKELCLKDDVIQAVKEGKFAIYPISHIDEGICILMGCEAGEKNEKNEFLKNTVHHKAMKKLEYFYNNTHNKQ